MTQPTDHVQKADVAADLRSITTCIPGRVCGGSRIFKFAADEIERLRKECGATQEHLTETGDLLEQTLMERDKLRLEVERLNAVVKVVAADLNNITRNAWPVESMLHIARNALAAIGELPESGK